MNRNTPKRISPCLTGRKRRKIWQRNDRCQEAGAGSSRRTGKALAEARLRGQREVMPSATDSTATVAPPDTMTQTKGTIDEESRSVKAPAETDKGKRGGEEGKDDFGLLQHTGERCTGTETHQGDHRRKHQKRGRLACAAAPAGRHRNQRERGRAWYLPVCHSQRFLFRTCKRKHQQHIGGGRTGQRSACQSTIRTGWKDFTYPSANSARQARTWRAVPCRAA